MKKNKDNNERINRNKCQINQFKSQPKQKQRPVSTGNYLKRNHYNVNKFTNNNNENKLDKYKLNAKNLYNQYNKKEDDNLKNDKNKIYSNKHKIIYERIEILKNGKKVQYNRGKPQVKYINIGNHYSQYKNMKNNIYNLRAKNNYQIIECGKGPNIIIQNKMMS